MHFKVIGQIKNIETIASGHGIDILKRLNRIYGNTNWRKLKGICRVELSDGSVVRRSRHREKGNKNQKISVVE